MGRSFSGTAGEVRIRSNGRAWIACVDHEEFGTGWIQRTHFVWWKYRRERVPRGWVLHHKDEDGLHDVMYNLQLVSKSEHGKIHMTAERSAKMIAGITPEIRKSTGKKLIGNKHLLGKKWTPEQLLNLSIGHTGLKHSLATRAKISVGNTGKTPTLEAREKNRQTHLGKKHTEEAKNKISMNNPRRKKKPRNVQLQSN